MRKFFALLPFLALAACGGSSGGVNTLGGLASPAPGTTGGTGGGVTGGTGGGVTAGTGGSGSTATPTSFLTANGAKTYNAVGGASSLSINSTNGSLYQGDASTVKSPLGTINYDPRDGIFTVTLNDTKSGVNANIRAQDPAHRTDFNPGATPQSGVPDFAGFNYLEVLNGTNDLSTFFYQRPGVATVYVTLAGYVRNLTPANPATQTFDRAAMVFGDQTNVFQVPASGTASYSGGFIASMVNNPTFDSTSQKPSYYQWVSGISDVNVDFGKQTFALALNGTVDSVGAAQTTIPDHASFTATGGGTIDLVRFGGFSGAFSSACFVAACGTAGAVPIDFTGVNPTTSTAGASSIDGAFYGPNAVNVGGSFRIIGGVPDQRVDMTGAFTGAKTGN
ncbi:MAG TPA: transferrin-binding protein-like solute binding protein [Sphingomonas sp.]|nr:transferrin-binding protein-like solute binding protein [Sphingomonas sp.]